jgi:membrane protease YdiL (CAAX protease family)
VSAGGPDQPTTLPRGPHPTVGPTTVTIPAWPGPVLAIGGGLVAIVALVIAELAAQGSIVADRSIFQWLAVIGAAAFVAGLLYVAVRQLRVRGYLPPERYRGPGVLILVLLVLALSFLLTIPFTADATALVTGEGDLTLLGSIALLVSTQVALLLVSSFLVFRPGALAGLPSLRGRDVGRALGAGAGLGVVAWFGSTIVAGGMAALLQAFGMEVEPQAAARAIERVEPWLVVVALVILAPIAEEIFFRGVVFNALRREGGRRWAYIGSALLFAVIHLDLVVLVPLFLLGLALAWLYERTNNLLAPIAMHATVNAISVVLALLVRFDVIPLPV